MTTTAVPHLDQDPPAARVEVFAEIAAAVAAGAPVPLTVYVASSGRHAALTVEHAEHVAVWATHLGLADKPVDTYRVSGTRWQTTTKAERGTTGRDVTLSVSHNAEVELSREQIADLMLASLDGAR